MFGAHKPNKQEQPFFPVLNKLFKMVWKIACCLYLKSRICDDAPIWPAASMGFAVSSMRGSSSSINRQYPIYSCTTNVFVLILHPSYKNVHSASSLAMFVLGIEASYIYTAVTTLPAWHRKTRLTAFAYSIVVLNAGQIHMVSGRLKYNIRSLYKYIHIIILWIFGALRLKANSKKKNSTYTLHSRFAARIRHQSANFVSLMPPVWLNGFAQST